MNNILWYQPEKLSDGDVVILNGNRLSYGKERDNAFDRLKKVADKAIGKKRPWQGYIDNYYFVKGSFDKVDERGRPLSFIFISDSENCKSELQNYLTIIGMSLSVDTSLLLKNTIDKWSAKRTMLLTALFLCIMLLIFFLNSKYGK